MMNGDKLVENAPVTSVQLMELLETLEIPFERHHHEALFSVSDSYEADHEIPGLATRNLFLRDKRETMFLITLDAHRKIDLGLLARLLGCGRLSFGSPERLMKYLGVTPGSVTPFSVINDRDHQVTLILDEQMMKEDIVNYHPLINTMTIGLAPSGLMKFLEKTGHKPQIIDLSPASGE